MYINLKQHVLFVIYLLLSFNVFCQYTNSKICIGGTGDEVIYSNYFGDNSSSYNFKSNDGGSIYFTYSNSTDGDFAPNKGYNDLVVVKINSSGELAFTKNIGNAFYEDDFIVKQSKDASRYFILLETHSNDSLLVNAYIGDVTIKYLLICIDNNGTVLWNKTLYNEINHIDNYSHSNYPNWFLMFIDQSDNCLIQYNKLGISTNNRYYDDSIIYSKIDKNGNTLWNKSVTPSVIYNNSDSFFLIDTFYINTINFNNSFSETENKYVLSVSMYRYISYRSIQTRNLVYLLDKSDASISSVLIDSSYSFNHLGIRDEFITYGNYKKYIEDSSNTYSYFHYRKYDEQLNKIYEKELMYNIPFEYIYAGSSSYSKTTYCNPMPYFNNDSTLIWFSTDIGTTASTYYYGTPMLIESTIKTYAYLINPANGAITKTVDLNKREFNSLIKKTNNVFYYYSFDTLNLSLDTAHYATITAYNFDGAELRNTNEVYGLSDNYNNYLLSNICNIENSIVLYNNTNSKLRFIVLDTLFNVIMQGITDTTSFPPNYFNYAAMKYNIHILDTNRYCVLQSIWLDTISGCYPNTNNIILNTFSKENILSSVKNNTSLESLTIYPNPNNGNFSIDFSLKGNYPITISLFDVTGRIVYQENIQHYNRSIIQISNAVLPVGLYNLQINSPNDIWNKKVLITK